MHRRFLFRTFPILLGIVMIAATIFAAVGAMHQNSELLHQKLQKEFVFPQGRPEVSQESIDRALKLFDIRVPKGVKHPQLMNLADRGVTQQQGIGYDYEVKVGPAAFSSWGMLGSTLSHEIEIHCHQNFALIRLLDILGLNGSLYAEREAYSFEESNAARFHLSDSEKSSIEETMNTYYPLAATGASKWSAFVKTVGEFAASAEGDYSSTFSALP